jgi:folate-binding protein YgfZ
VSLRPEAAAWLRDRATVIVTRPAVFRVEGPGAIECVQGVLTNDVVRPGPDSLVYGAMLSVRGMILVDAWVLRDHRGLTLVAPSARRAVAAGVFQRQFPPRLARVADLSETFAALWGVGAGVESAARDAGIPLPQTEGKTAAMGAGPTGALVARASEVAPWSMLVLGTRNLVEVTSSKLQEAGALAGSEDHLEAARILAGWPAIDLEIGEKTLPQEVRYDDIGGVSYTKGCYVGQETVARVHFRGHPNRHLRGLVWDGDSIAPGAAVTVGEKDVGRVTSALDIGTRRFGLSVLRREVAPGAIVTVGGLAVARVCDLPFATELVPS